MPMMLLEVITIRVPIVCSDIRENISIVGLDYNYLFKPGCGKSLREKINEIVSDPNIEVIRSDLYNTVIKKFNWVKLTSEYQNLYKYLINKK